MARSLAIIGFRRAQRRNGALLLMALAALSALCICTLGARPSPAWASAPHHHGHKGKHAEEKQGFGAVLASIVTAHALLFSAVVVVVCTFLAKQEPPPAPTPPNPVEKRTDLTRVYVLSVLLSGVSGMVNAVAILEMGGTVSHHTGNASHAGRLLGVDGERFAVLILAYLVGAGVAGFHKCDGEALFLGKACPVMLSSAAAVAAGALIEYVSHRALVTLPLWAFSQGMHNAVTTKFSSMPLRTTHITGNITDAGAACGLWLRAQLRGETPPPAEKTLIWVLTILAFGGGGVLAKICCHHWGVLAALPPAAVGAALGLGLIPWGAVPTQKKVA